MEISNSVCTDDIPPFYTIYLFSLANVYLNSALRRSFDPPILYYFLQLLLLYIVFYSFYVESAVSLAAGYRLKLDNLGLITNPFNQKWVSSEDDLFGLNLQSIYSPVCELKTSWMTWLLTQTEFYMSCRSFRKIYGYRQHLSLQTQYLLLIAHNFYLQLVGSCPE